MLRLGSVGGHEPVCGQTRGDPDPRGTDPMEDRTNFFIGWGTLALVNAGLAQGKGRSGLPKMQRAGWSDVSNVAVTVNELTPVSEPLYAVA